MQMSGQVFVNAPHDKVWRALQDATTLDSCLQETGAVRRVSDTELQVGAPVHGPVRIVRTPPDTLVYEAAGGRLTITLSSQSGAMTLLRYALEAEGGDAAQAKVEVDQLLAAFQAQVAGPREFAASGAAGAQAAAIND